MKHPHLREEKKLWKKGYKAVIGIDEAGRGALAGPVLAAAVLFNPLREKELKKQFLRLRIKDSKKLNPKRREEIYHFLQKSSLIKWGIGVVSEKIIDRINIAKAAKLAMERALKNLINLEKKNNKKFSIKSCFLLVDGSFSIKAEMEQKSIIKGDEKVFSCALASIIAKVERDRIMTKHHQKYFQYGFIRHKGYGTKLHLRKYGPSVIHRKTFRLI